MTGEGSVKSNQEIHDGLQTNEVSLIIQEEETSIISDFKSLDSLHCHKEKVEHDGEKFSVLSGCNGDKLSPGSRTTINSADSLDIENEDQKL